MEIFSEMIHHYTITKFQTALERKVDFFIHIKHNQSTTFFIKEIKLKMSSMTLRLYHHGLNVLTGLLKVVTLPAYRRLRSMIAPMR